jgi:class 3 adenylate cyclase
VRPLPSGTVTLLFTDIEGSTRLLERLGGEYEYVLAEHRWQIREAVSAHGGAEVDTQGDAFLCAFARASDAVEAAAEAQRALAQTSVRVRMGIHTGEPTRTEEGYVGVDLHRGARLMAAGHGGQVLLSQTTRELLSDHPVRDLGEHRLKDLSEPQKLYQLLGEGLEADFAPPKTLENRPTNLPTQPTPLVGREQELEQVLELLGREQVRLVTLTGPGGTGKTRLALQAAAELVERYPDGVWFVNLAALTDPELVVPTIAQTLGIKEQAGEAIADILAGKLQEQQPLLLLDNFEQVIQAAPALAGLLAQAPRLKTVVTSRSSLHLQGEHEYAVPPLAGEEALALFAERAQAAKASFSLDGNRAVVEEICRRLDQLPLAIELAAARIKLLPEQALLERLDQKLKLLTGGASDMDELAGGRSRRSRQSATPTESWTCSRASPRSSTRACCAGRRVKRESRASSCSRRFTTTRATSWTKTARRSSSSGGTHASSSNSQGKPRRRQTGRGTGSKRWIPSARTSARRSDGFGRFARQTWRSSSPSPWRTFGRAGGPVIEGRAALTEALGRARDAPGALRLRARTKLGALAYFQGDYRAAIAQAEAALELARGLGEKGEIANSLGNLGLSHIICGEADRAVPLLEECIRLELELGRTRDAAVAKSNLAYVWLILGDARAAADAAGEASELARELDDGAVEALALCNLGLAQLRQEALAEAAANFRRGVRSALDASMTQSVANGLLGVAAVAADYGADARAATLIGAADDVIEAIEGSFEPYEHNLREDVGRSLRDRLGEEAFERTLGRALSMTIEEAVAYALQDTT